MSKRRKNIRQPLAQYPSLLELIQLVKPDVYVKGRDWIGKKITAQAFLESTSCPTVYPPNYINITTTKIIQQIKSNQSPHHGTIKSFYKFFNL